MEKQRKEDMWYRGRALKMMLILHIILILIDSFFPKKLA